MTTSAAPPSRVIARSEATRQSQAVSYTHLDVYKRQASYSARGWFGQVSFPSTDEFYYDLTGEQESDLQVYWQDNTLRIVSESPGEVTLHLKDLKDTCLLYTSRCV